MRRADRAAQGITAQQESAAWRDLERAEFSGHGSRVKVWCPDGSTAAHSDGLYGKALEMLLMAPDEWNHYGPGHRALAAMFDGAQARIWCGGADESGYFRIASPDEMARHRIPGQFAGAGLKPGAS